MLNRKIGIVGGGQLGMFICEAAKEQKIDTIIYSNTNDFSAKSCLLYTSDAADE